MLGDKKQAPADGCMAWIVSLSTFSVSMLELDLVLTAALDWRRLLSRLRPGRRVKMYWHTRLRLSHLEQVGFSLGHLTLDIAQAWQLSRSLLVVAAAEVCPGALGVRTRAASASTPAIGVRRVAVVKRKTV